MHVMRLEAKIPVAYNIANKYHTRPVEENSILRI